MRYLNAALVVIALAASAYSLGVTYFGLSEASSQPVEIEALPAPDSSATSSFPATPGGGQFRPPRVSGSATDTTTASSPGFTPGRPQTTPARPGSNVISTGRPAPGRQPGSPNVTQTGRPQIRPGSGFRPPARGPGSAPRQPGSGMVTQRGQAQGAKRGPGKNTGRPASPPMRGSQP